jgi:hypothetical protein
MCSNWVIQASIEDLKASVDRDRRQLDGFANLLQRFAPAAALNVTGDSDVIRTEVFFKESLADSPVAGSCSGLSHGFEFEAPDLNTSFVQDVNRRRSSANDDNSKALDDSDMIAGGHSDTDSSLGADIDIETILSVPPRH